MGDVKALPGTHEVAISREVATALLELERAVAQAATLRDTYQAGLCAGMGLDSSKVLSMRFDSDPPVLIVADDPPSDA